MNIENPIAFSFIMQDDIYLLENDKQQYTRSAADEAGVSAVAEPEPAYIPLAQAFPVPAAPETVNFKYLGGHKKGFLIIAHYQDHDFMHEKHLAALESAIGRLGFERDDVAILNRANYMDAGIEELAGFFSPKKLLILGKNSLPKELSALELNRVKQGRNFPALLTFSFDEMMDSVENKKVFWEQMKQL